MRSTKVGVEVAFPAVGLLFFPFIALFTFISYGEKSSLFATLSWLCFIVPLLFLPFVRYYERYVLLALSLTIFIGTSARSLYILLSESQRADFLRYGLELQSINNATLLMLLGVLAFCIAFVSAPGKIVRLPRFLASSEPLPLKKTLLFGTILLAISIVALVIYAYLTGGSIGALFSSSSKRQIAMGYVDGEAVYGQFGEVKYLIYFANAALILVIATFHRAQGSTKIWSIGVILCSAGVGVTAAFYTSSRNDLLAIIFIFIATYIFRRRFSWLKFSIICIVAVAGAMLLGALRVAGTETITAAHDFTSPIDTIVGSSNFVSNTLFARLVEDMPERVPYRMGETYAAVATAFIPRSVWPAKPQVSVGPWVRSDILQLPTRGFGIPPGLLGEGYINFGILGVFGAAVAAGFLLKNFCEQVVAKAWNSEKAFVLTAVLFLPLAFHMFHSNFSLIILNVFTINFPVFLLFLSFYIFNDRRTKYISARTNRENSQQAITAVARTKV